MKWARTATSFRRGQIILLEAAWRSRQVPQHRMVFACFLKQKNELYKLLYDNYSNIYCRTPPSKKTKIDMQLITNLVGIVFFPTCQVRVVRFYVSCLPLPLLLPSLNREHPRPVFPAGPQPRVSTPSVPCRTSTATSRSQWTLPDRNGKNVRKDVR